MQLRIIMPVKCWWLLKIEQTYGRAAKATVQSALTFKLLGFSSSLMGSKGFGPFLSRVWADFREGTVLFLVTTCISPSRQAYAELHALSSLRESIIPWHN